MWRFESIGLSQSKSLINHHFLECGMCQMRPARVGFSARAGFTGGMQRQIPRRRASDVSPYL
jgi:hypothetical protein